MSYSDEITYSTTEEGVDVKYTYARKLTLDSTVKRLFLFRVFSSGTIEVLYDSDFFEEDHPFLSCSIPAKLFDREFFSKLVSSPNRSYCIRKYLLGNYVKKYEVGEHLSDYIHADNNVRYARQIGEYTVVYTVPNVSNGVDLSYRAFELLGNGGIILVADDVNTFGLYRPIENIDTKFFLNLVRTAMACEYDSDDFDTEKECDDAYENYAEKESEIYRYLLEF